MDQKGLKMHEKKQKIEFSNLKYLLFSGIFLSGIGGYPPSPLTENHLAQKPLAEKGGTPPLLNGKNPLSSFGRVPLSGVQQVCGGLQQERANAGGTQSSRGV